MAKYKDLKELAEAFRSGKLTGWVLMVDNDCTYLRWDGGPPEGIEPDSDAGYAFEEKKDEEGDGLYNGNRDVYILDQALSLAGIPNMGV